MHSFIFGLKWSFFALHIKKKRKILLTSFHPSPNYPFACKCVLIFHIIYMNSVLGLVGAGDDYPQPKMRGLGDPEHFVF